MSTAQTHKAQARTYGVLAHARKARGDRMEAELGRLVQARQQAIELERQARNAEREAGQTLRDFTLRMREKRPGANRSRSIR